jgi:hypothetical protein
MCVHVPAAFTEQDRGGPEGCTMFYFARNGAYKILAFGRKSVIFRSKTPASRTCLELELKYTGSFPRYSTA